MYLAEREGFEPSIQFPVYTLSRRAPSATRTPLQQAADHTDIYLQIQIFLLSKNELIIR